VCLVLVAAVPSVGKLVSMGGCVCLCVELMPKLVGSLKKKYGLYQGVRWSVPVIKSVVFDVASVNVIVLLQKRRND
jgi:hypothetical protein